MEWLRKYIKERRHRGMSGAGLAKAIDRPKARIYELYKGKWRIPVNKVADAARYLEMTESEFLRRIESGGVQIGAIAQGLPVKRNSLPPAALILWSTLPSAAGDPGGAFMLSTEKAGELDRPESLRYAKKAFAFKIIGHDNDPVYRHRDIVDVNPDEAVDERDDCVFTNEAAVSKGTLAVVANLVKITDTLWIIRQYSSTTNKELSRKDFPSAWLIVTRHHRR